MSPIPPIDVPFFRPLKTVEEADRLMQHAHVLYEQHGHILRPTERTLADDRMTFATDVRHGVEEKFWLAQAKQASLYSGRAQEALETVKVVGPIPSPRRGTDEFFLVPPEASSCFVGPQEGGTRQLTRRELPPHLSPAQAQAEDFTQMTGA
ncbi:hypothetical protein H4582DRAFT_2051206 [Lactarius indigo]|nr:hypothetical protein H4582DRAFT_2051206 [Lactarius indigo]